MLIEKEVISPGTYWYAEEGTGLPRKLDVSPDMTKYWHAEGMKMLGAGLTIPVPFEHDFKAHPMTPKEQLLSNAGWVKEYRLHDGNGGKGDRLFSVLDILDEEVAKKLPRTIRWTSPWINSFTDGQGHEWKNVISHLALTTRPRITKQAPFPSVAAALSMATTISMDTAATAGGQGFCLSRAGRLFLGKKSNRLHPQYPIAFSLWGGVKFASEDVSSSDEGPPKKSKKSAPPEGGGKSGDGGGGGKNGSGDGSGDGGSEGGKPSKGPPNFDGGDGEDGEDGGDGDGMDGLDNPLEDSMGDVRMEELLCDLLQALGVPMPDDSNPTQFKRHLYEATMCKIKELAASATMNAAKPPTPGGPASPNPAQPQTGGRPGMPNPLVQQEQQPMYMSLEDINKITDQTMKAIALGMYAENQKLQQQLDAQGKISAALRDAKLREATAKRVERAAMIGRLSPRVKTDLDAMLALPSMALSMADDGSVTDPMAQTLAVLEKGLADLPKLMTADISALSVQAQPMDADMLTTEKANELAADMARMMGCAPERKAG